MALTFNEFKKEFLNNKKDFDFVLNKENRGKLRDFIGTDASVMLQVIVVRANQLVQMDPSFYSNVDGSLPFPVKEIKEITELTEKRQKDALSVLEEIELIQVEYVKNDYRDEGFKTKRVININFSKIASFVDNFVGYLKLLDSKFKYRYDFKKLVK